MSNTHPSSGRSAILRSALNLVAFLAIVSSGSSVLAAPPAAAVKPPVEVTVWTVLATKASRSVDPGLAALAPLMQKAFTGYQGFTLLSTTAWPASDDRSRDVALPNGRKLQIAYQGLDAGFVRLDLSIPPHLSTSVRVAEGGTFFQAGMNHGSGILVLAISAKRVAPAPAPASGR